MHPTKILRKATTTVATTLVCTALAACAHDTRAAAAGGDAERAGESAEREAAETELDVRDVAAEAKVTLADAVRAAVAARPGTAIEAELEGEVADGKREVFYEVLVLGVDGGVFEVKVDPASGSVVAVEAERDADDVKEVRAAGALLPAGSASLLERIAEAEAKSGARAVKAKLEAENGGLDTEVKLLRGRELVEVTSHLGGGRPAHALNVVPSGPHMSRAAHEDEDEGDEDGDDDEEGEDDVEGR